MFFDINMTVAVPQGVPVGTPINFGNGQVLTGQPLFDATTPTGTLEILLNAIPAGGPVAPFLVNHTMTINGVSLSISNFELMPANVIFAGTQLTALDVTFGSTGSSIGYTANSGSGQSLVFNFSPFQFFNFTYALTPQTAGNPIPEPGTIASMLAGLAGLAALSVMRRRRRLTKKGQGGGI